MNSERDEAAGIGLREWAGVAAGRNGDFNAEGTEYTEGRSRWRRFGRAGYKAFMGFLVNNKTPTPRVFL